MGSFLIWNKATKEVLSCLPHPYGSKLTLKACAADMHFSEEEYSCKDIVEDLTTSQFNAVYAVDLTDEIVHVDSLKSMDTRLAEAKGIAAGLVAYKRYVEEVGGVTLPSGAKIKTDRESQGQLAGALMSLSSGFVDHIDWKAEGGWVELNLADVQAISAVVSQHVQALFTKEKSKIQLIEAATTIEEVEAIAW